MADQIKDDEYYMGLLKEVRGLFEDAERSGTKCRPEYNGFDFTYERSIRPKLDEMEASDLYQISNSFKSQVDELKEQLRKGLMESGMLDFN